MKINILKKVSASTRMLIMTFRQVDIRYRMACKSRFFLTRDFDKFSRSKFLNINISQMVRASAKIAHYDFYACCYSPSNGITANVVVNDLDLNLQGQTFQVAV